VFADPCRVKTLDREPRSIGASAASVAHLSLTSWPALRRP